MRVPEHAPRGPFDIHEPRYGLVEIVERGAGVLVERPCVIPLHSELDYIIFTENASRYGNRFAQQRLGLFGAM